MECSNGVAKIIKLFLFLTFITFAKCLTNPDSDPDYSNAFDLAVAYLKSNPALLDDGDDPYIYIQVPVDDDESNAGGPNPIIDIHLPPEVLEEINKVQSKEDTERGYIDIQVPSEPYLEKQAPGYPYDYYQQNQFNLRQNSYARQQNLYAQQQRNYMQQRYPYVYQANINTRRQQYPYVQEENPYASQQPTYDHDQNPYVHQENPYVHQENPYVHEEEPYIHEENPYIHEEVPYVHDEVPYADEKSYIDIEYTVRVPANELKATSESKPGDSLPADPMIAFAQLQAQAAQALLGGYRNNLKGSN